MAGLTDQFGKEKKTRFMEMFLPIIAGVGASFMPNGGEAMQGLGTVLSKSYERRGRESALRQQDMEFEALKEDADDNLNALNAELARLEGSPYVYNPELSRERNALAAAERNQRVTNLKTQIRTAGDAFGAIYRHSATTRDPSKAVAAMGVLMNSINSASGIDQDMAVAIAKLGLDQNQEDIQQEERDRIAGHQTWQREFAERNQGLQEREFTYRQQRDKEALAVARQRTAGGGSGTGLYAAARRVADGVKAEVLKLVNEQQMSPQEAKDQVVGILQKTDPEGYRLYIALEEEQIQRPIGLIDGEEDDSNSDILKEIGVL